MAAVTTPTPLSERRVDATGKISSQPNARRTKQPGSECTVATILPATGKTPKNRIARRKPRRIPLANRRVAYFLVRTGIEDPLSRIKQAAAKIMGKGARLMANETHMEWIREAAHLHECVMSRSDTLDFCRVRRGIVQPNVKLRGAALAGLGISFLS